MYFLHFEVALQDVVINDIAHDQNLNNFTNIPTKMSLQQVFNQVRKNPNSVVKLEKFYYLPDQSRVVVNYKINKSSMYYEMINLGTDAYP